MQDEGVQPSRRRRRVPEGPKTSPITWRMMGVVAVIAMVLVGAAIAIGQALRQPAPGVVGNLQVGSSVTGQSADAGAATQAAADLPPKQPIVYDGQSKGPKDAPVEIIEFADFQCPICGQHARLVGPQIDDAYVSRGLVRVTMKYFSFIGPESAWAAMAAECANDQGKFWPFHDKLFANQNNENQGAFAKDKLKGFAGDIGLDRTTFDGCLDSEKHAGLVKDQFTEGRNLGVRATPSFFIGEQKVEGAQSFAYFQRLIDNELKKR